MTPRLTFVSSELVAETAAAAFREHADRIRLRLPEAEIRHVGGTSVPGVLTAGDVDLQVRVPPADFDSAREVLSELYEPYHREVWHAGGAFFSAPGAEPRVELALTAIGSIDDLHHGEAWQQIATSPALIERYNAMKRAHDGRSREAYDAAKRAFFYENFRL